VHQLVRSGIAWSAAAGALASSATVHAEPAAAAPPSADPAVLTEPATVAAPAPVWVWYRSSEGCPDGASFIARLAELGQSAQLAGVGDRVDFVVTLGRVADSSSGRLERQTRGGTVAMREYQDARCEQVAEALALTLDLALDPEAAPPAATAPPVAVIAPPPAVVAAPLAVTAKDTGAPALGSSEAERFTLWRLGLQGVLQSGLAPQVAFGGALFLAVEDPSWLVRQLRAAVFALHAEGQAQARQLSVSVLGARLEGCPIAWSAPGVAFYPCVGVDVGALHAAGKDALGTSDTGVWAAALVHGRAAFELGAELALEAQLGATVPLVKYEMGPTLGDSAWFRTRALGLEAGLGIAWRIP
jgi:hypothetical protein